MNPRDRSVEIMRGVIRGDIEIQATVWPFVNSVVIKGLDRGGEFWMSFFVDADELDYVEALVAGDPVTGGLVADFDALWDDETGTDPIDLLETAEVDGLSFIIQRSEAIDPKALWDAWCALPSNQPVVSGLPQHSVQYLDAHI
jgi:hypothetical protein